MRYDPEKAPPAAEWLDTDEGERILLVRQHHHRAGIKVPGLRAHAAIHVVVENQLAMGIPAVCNAMSRLRGEGLSRHEAIHAIGFVLSNHMWAAIREPLEGDPNERYERDLEKLTVARWHEMAEED
jgi:hypothetical protein